MKTLEEIYGQYTPPQLVAEPRPQVQPYQYQQYGAGQYINPQTNQQELAEAWDYIFKDSKQQAQPQVQAQQIDTQETQPENYSLLSKLYDIGANAWDQDTLDKIAQEASNVQYVGSLPQEQYVADQVNQLSEINNHAKAQGFTLPIEQQLNSNANNLTPLQQQQREILNAYQAQEIARNAPIRNEIEEGVKTKAINKHSNSANELAKLYRQYKDVEGEIGERDRKLQDSNFLITGANDIAKSIPLMARRTGTQVAYSTAGALAPVPGGTAVGSALGALEGARLGYDTQYGHNYFQALENGTSPEVADIYAKVGGAIEGGLGQIPIMKFGKGGILKSVRNEAAEEASTELMHIINELYHDQNPEFRNAYKNGDYASLATQIAKRAAYAGTIGGVMGGAMHGVAKGSEKAINKAFGKETPEQATDQPIQPADPSTAQGLADNITTNAYTAPERTETQQERKVKANGKALNEILAPFNENEEKYNGYHDDLINDIADGTINESAKQPTEYGRLAKEYLVKTGQYQQEPVQQEQPKQPKVFTGPVIEGTNDEVDIGDNEYQPFTYTLMEADDLDPTVNKSSNQYRDRNRQSSNAQVQNIANNLDPRKVGASPTMDYGSPVIANDNQTIIAGNGRTMAINQAYGLGKAENYRQDLVSKANEYGFSPEQVSQFKKPVLVRKLNNDVDVRKTAIRSNEQGGLRMSSLEQAKVDAERLPDIANIEGDLTNPSNRSYVNQFIQNQPENLRNEYLDSKGQLSQTGVTRLRNAILHKAYGDTDILNRAVESADQQQKNILNALTQVASKVAKTKDSVAQGNLDPNADISQDIINAVDKFNQAKLNGKTIEEYINQQDFVSEMSPTEKQLLRLFGENNRSAKKIATTLNNFYRVAESKANTQQASMFGDVEFNPAEELVNAENIDEDLLSTSEGKSDREVLEDLLGKEVADKIEFVAPDSPMPRGENLKSLVDKGVEGWFNPRTNKIYLVAESIQANGILNRQERLAWVATHELAHAGVKNKYSNLLNNVLKNARSHLLVKGIADKIKKDRANRGLPIDDMVATEEALVELYAAVKTGKWDELENRYGIKIHNSWRTGERSVEPLLNRVANVLKRLMSQVIGRPITDEEVFTILSGIEKGIDTYAKSGRDTDGNGEVKYRLNDRQKEQRGIYNVSFNDKKSTQIKKDLEDVSKAIKYEKGFEDRQRNVGFGSLHIEKHLDPQKDGFVTSQELVNMGDIIRNVEPYESRGKRVYEYTNDKGVTFKVIVGNKRNGERVISFYSNRRVGEENDTLPYIYSNPSNENNNAQSGISQDESLNKDEKFSTSQNNSSQDLVANAIDEGKTLKEIQEDKNILRAVAKDIEPEYEEFLNSDSNHKLMKNMRRRFLNAWKNDDFSRENGSHVLEGIIKEHYNGHKESNPTTNDLVQKAVDERREITSLRADEKFLDDFADALTRENNKVIASDTSTDTEKKVAKYYNEWLAKDSTIDNSYLIKEIENRYYKAEAERAKAKPKEVVKEKAPPAEEKPKRRFNENASPKELDRQYFKALDDGDNELAQQIVDFMAEKKGYDTSDNFRMDHKAPSSKTDNPNALNIMEHDLIPNDLWEHPEHYVNREDMPTFYDVKRFLDRVEKYKRGELDKMPRMIVYRAVPKDLKEGEIRNGDWVTPSLDYAKFHGATNVGKYRIIKKAIPADQVYWNGDSIQEWGVDDSKSYAYKNTKNNRKLADLETRDDDGEIIPPSKRFNARKDDIRFSVADKDYKRDLVVTHNISADGIIHADKMGGLPFASIAVTKQDNPLTGFGEVTLIGDRNYIDPKGENKAKVFGSDIYSPRYPNVRYKIKTKDLVKLYKNFSKTAREVNDTSFDYHFSEDNILDKGVRDTLLNSEAVKYQFLKDEGVAPDVIYKEGGISQYGPTAIKIAKENLEIDTGLVKDYAQERIKTLKAQKERRVANAKARNMPEEKINGYIERADKSINNYQKVIDGDTAQIEEARFELEAYVDVVKDELSSEPTIDNVATLKAINEKVKEREDDFVSYVDDIADDVDQQEVLYNGTNSRGAPTYQKHTLENVVKKLKKDLRGGENATYNIGSLRGKVTPKFKSIEDIQRNKDRLVGSEDFERVKGEVSREIEDSGEKLDLNLDETLELLDDVIDNGVPKAFKNQGVDNTPNNRNIIKDILAKLENMPTEYFEGKAKEVTQFSDFKGAVIPDNLKGKARKILENAGLKLFDYKAGDQDSRAKAIKSATNKLDEESGDVLFSVAGNKEFEDTAKKYGGEQAYEQAVDNGDTELNYKQWVQVRTPSFKKWFGDWENDPDNASQVVNEKTGEPLVVYHGSTSTDQNFNVFEIYNEGSFFSDDYGVSYRYARMNDKQGSVRLFFLNLKNPEFIPTTDEKIDLLRGADVNLAKRVLHKEKNSKKQQGYYVYQERVRKQAIRKGYDGFILEDHSWDGELDNSSQYVAFTPNQIKSATDNTGEFNSDNEDIRFSTAWHGSPHSFDKFSTEFMGSGEGAQAYGWGLYFTDLEDIAREYAHMGTEVKVNGKLLYKNNKSYIHNFDTSKVEDDLALNALVAYTGDKAKATEYLESFGISDITKKSIEALNDYNVKISKGRNLYKVKIHGDKTIDELNFIQWDKRPSDKNIKTINEALKKLGEKTRRTKNKITLMYDGYKDEILLDDGADLYYGLKSYFHSDKKASEFLLKNGIDGIQYPANSRSDSSDNGSYNYVVFDDKAIEIQDHIRFSTSQQKQSASDLAKTGKAVDDESILKALSSKEGRKALFNKMTSTLDEHITDALRPVEDWMEDSLVPVIGEVDVQNLRADLRLAKGKRDALVKDIESKFLKPLLTSLAKISKKYKLDETTTKRLVGYWASARWAIDKNAMILEKERQIMLDAEKEYQDIKLQYDLENQNGNVSDETQALLDNADNEYRRAKRQYEYRKHDVELGVDSDEKFKVGTAGGWSIAQAKQIMKDIEKHISKEDLLDTTKHLYRLNQHRLDIDRTAGRYTEEQYREMKLNKHYVPLTGDPNGDVFDSITGAGDKAVNVSKDKALKGRKNSEAEDAIDASWKGISNSATYAGWADFKQDIDDIYQTEFDRLVDEEGMTDKQAKKEIKETLGITKSRMLGITRPSDNVLIRKHGGVYYQYELPTKVMRALKNDNVEDLNAFFDLLAKPTRLYARGVTQWMAHFAPMNMVRDLWEKSEFVRVQKIYDKEGKRVDSKTLDKIGRDTIRNGLTPSSGVLNATRKFALGKGDTSTPEGKMLQDLIDFGGVSTWRTYLDPTEKDLIKKVKKENSTVGKGLEKAGEVIKTYNAGFDLVSSLAAYKALVDNGVEPKQAAAVTLELTNFRKQGSSMRAVKALYMFSQPQAMGGRNLAVFLSTPKGRKRFLGYMIAMSAMYAMLNSFTDDDDDLDLLGDITRYIPIPTGNKEYIKIPVGFGMPQLAWNFSVNLSRLATAAITPTEAISNMSEQLVRSGFPVSPSNISASKDPLAKAVLTVTPTFVEPFVQVALNKNAFGNPIHSSFGNSNKVRADQGKATTPEFWKDVSYFLLDNFGMNVYPEDIQNLSRGYSGMLGSLKDIQTVLIDNPNNEKLGRPTRTPIFNQLFGAANIYAKINMYYQASEEARSLANRVKSQKERGLNPKLTPLEQKELKWFKVAERQEKAKRSYKSRLTRRLNNKELSQAKYDELLTNKRKQMEVIQNNLLNGWREMHGLKTY